jgi:hypothetical protein
MLAAFCSRLEGFSPSKTNFDILLASKSALTGKVPELRSSATETVFGTNLSRDSWNTLDKVELLDLSV